MADFTKKPLGKSLVDIGRQQALSAIQQTGKALPCRVVEVVSSGIVKVSFEVDAAPYTLPQITVPIEYPEYIRYPIQPGDTGMVFPADVRISGVCGLGGGVPTLSQPGNLSALSFVWLGSKNWTATDDPNAVVIYGPDGVVLRDSGSTTKLVLTPSGVTITGNVVVNGTITATGDVTGQGTSLHTHVHTGVTGGTSDTGPPA
jgi:hypothetical protein